MQGDLFLDDAPVRSMPIAYIITADIYDAAIDKLQTIARDQWPSPEMYDRVYIGVRLYQMELSEREADRSPSPTEGDADA